MYILMYLTDAHLSRILLFLHISFTKLQDIGIVHLVCNTLPFTPHPLYLSSGQGSHYGTFSGPTGAFSAATKPKEKYKAPGKNFLTNPGKKGTGFGLEIAHTCT